MTSITRSEINVRLGANLRKRRRELDLTQADIAGALEISYQAYARYESAENRMSAEMLFKAAAALKSDPGAFFEGIDHA